MNRTGAQLAETQGQAGEPPGDESQHQQQLTPLESAQPANEQASDPSLEKPEDRLAATQKETPATSNGGETAVDAPDATLHRPFTQLLPLPRKQVIPPRRTLHENGHGAPFAAPKYVWPADNATLVPQAEEYEAAELPTSALPAVAGRHIDQPHQAPLADLPTRELPTPKLPEARIQFSDAQIQTQKMPVSQQSAPSGGGTPLAQAPTTPLPALAPGRAQGGQGLTRGRAALLALLLLILIMNVSATGFGQFFGPQGWGAVFNTAGNTNQRLLNQLRQELQQTPTPGVAGQPTSPALAPNQIVDRLLAHMTLAQKLGQMLMIRFNSLNYSPLLDAMVTHYHVGAVIEYQGNIESQAQLSSLNAQIQHNGDLPMIISIDQEGGTVDRLRNLDGPQPSASTLGATNDPQMAYQQGLKDAQNLAAYGFNLNLAPVVDVNNIYNAQLYARTFSTKPAMVTALAGAYLSGLQHSGKVLGSIKHFPGLGDTSTDPHYGLPYLARSLESLNAVDWAPYKSLIARGNIYAVMVTHEIVRALDPQTPSSLSPRVISILRHQLGFQGVIITDGLTMRGITNSYTLGQAAVLAVQAGDDLLMDPGSPNEVAQMIGSLTQALQTGALSQQRIDDAVRRILLLKYEMGLFQLHS
ncbi:MAG TPA: glycoside hydrolase family 3 N-terminal domain-containing protein [Ktedonobacteraceae bacterium]|jgi:beta-N-acetylhexosaminidase